MGKSQRKRIIDDVPMIIEEVMFSYLDQKLKDKINPTDADLKYFIKESSEIV